MEPISILAVIGGAAVAFFGGRKLVQTGEKVEDWKRGAVWLAGWTQENGLGGTVPQLLTNLAVNDLSGVFNNFRDITAATQKPAEAEQLLRNFLKVQLLKQLSTVEGREELIVFVEKNLDVKIDRDAIRVKPVELGEVKADA